MKYLLGSVLVYLLLNSSISYAEQFTVTAVQLNKQIQQRFPIVRQYDDVEATFYNPKVIVRYLDNEIEIKLQVKVTYQGQTLEANGLIKDTATFQPVSNTLRFDRPQLDEFFITQDNMSDSTEAVKVVKQSISRSLPPIILLDFEQLDLNLLSNEPIAITLSPLGLELEY
tara:strand:+ start:342 stop:851 length:510 start_codon:yes stop_codon:yes gene_type:complete